MTKNTSSLDRSVPSAAGSKKPRSYSETTDEKTTGGPFFTIQQPLIHLIEEYLLTHLVNGKKMTLKVFCDRSGMTVPGMTAIMNGNRWAAKCSRETIDKLAEFLEIPVLQVFVLSGFITMADVVFSPKIEETLDAVFRMMSKDKRMSYRAPTEADWNTWPRSAKLCVCMMYEDMLNRVFFRYTTIESEE